MKTRQRLELCSHSQGDSWRSNKEGFSLEPLEEAPPCQRLDFRLPSSRSVREYVPVVSGYQVCGNLYDSPRKLINPTFSKSEAIRSEG